MSAWVVEREHIDVLLKAGFAHVNAGPIQGHRLSWFTEDPEEVGYGQAYETRRELRFDTADEVGRMLVEENVASVCYRYAHIPEENADAYEADLNYRYRDPGFVPTPGEVFKAIGCLDYQSCEHEGWKNSEARRFLDALRDEMIGLLYDGAWGWDANSVAERRATLAVV